MKLKEDRKLQKVLIILSVLLMIANPIYSQNVDWKGIYVFDEESRDEEGTWSRRWFRLVVKEVKGKLQAEYSDGENIKTWKCFLLKVKIKKDTANFYFEKNLECSSFFKKGDFVFKLKKKEGNKLETIWGKINLGAYSELGGLQEDGVFFRKVSN